MHNTEDLTRALATMLRKGWVTSVDSGNNTARVRFEDYSGMTSGDLHVLRAPTGIQAAEGHTHGATAWLPAKGDFVLCLFEPGSKGGAGYILGII